MSVRERFIERIDSLADKGLVLCRGAKYRGGFTRDELNELDRLKYFEYGTALMAYQIAAEYEGLRVPDRRHLIPNVLDRKGLHLSNSGDRPAIYIYGEIGGGYGGITADDFRSQLSAISPRAPLDLHVHSPGGSYVEGVAIHSQIKNRAGKTYGFVDGKAASAASFILMACSTVTMSRGSQMMVHYASIESEGSWGESDLERVLSVVKETNRHVFEFYKERWRGTEKELDEALKAETYYSPEQAIEVGLADFVSDAVKIAAYADTGKQNSPSFSLSASEGPHKHFCVQEAGFQLWKMLADEMRAKG